jgi:hypothetical protein
MAVETNQLESLILARTRRGIAGIMELWTSTGAAFGHRPK